MPLVSSGPAPRWKFTRNSLRRNCERSAAPASRQSKRPRPSNWSRHPMESPLSPTATTPCAGAAVPDKPSPQRWMFRRDVVICVLLGLVSFAIYNANLRSITAVDTYAARYLPLSIWHNHTIALDPVADLIAEGRKFPPSKGSVDAAWWIASGRNDRLVSFYPVVVPVLIAPLYLPAVLYLNERAWDPLGVDRVARIMEKISASLLAAASVALLYLLMRRRCDPKTATLLAIVYAFGTTTWGVSSQALWMHGLAELLIVAMLLLLTGPCTRARALTAGLVCGLIACNRQPDVILAAALGLYGLWWAKRMLPLIVSGAALPVGLILAYNLFYVGHIVGGYGFTSQARISEFLNDNPFVGMAGLLVSPTRGLFVFSPFLLFIFFCLPSVFRDRSMRGLTVLVGVAAVLQVVLYGLGDWRQGMSWGPRWLTDMLPILFWMLPPVLAALSAT